MASIESISYGLVSKALELSNLLRNANIPQPSFDPSSALDFEDLSQRVDDSIEKKIRQARNALIDGANDLALLAKGPTDTLLGLSWSHVNTSTLAIIAKFKIPELIPMKGSRTISELAAATNLPEDILARSVRYAITNGIFNEPSPGMFTHSAMSARLAQGGHMRNIVTFSAHEVSTWITLQSKTLLQQVELGDKGPHAAFNLLYPQYKDAFDFFHNEAEANEDYHKYLEGRTQTSRWAVDTFLRSWDWERIKSGVMVDCGGSLGHSCVALATSKCPQADFIVQDMNKNALQMGRNSIAKNSDLGSRINFVEHDFFTPQKVVAGTYLFRHILHDWSDSDSVKIIKALVPALRKGARVLVAEGIMPSPPITRSSTLDSRNVQIEDMIMMAAHSAKERTAQEFEVMFKEASPDFRLVGVSGGGDGVFQSIVEFEWTGEDAPVNGHDL